MENHNVLASKKPIGILGGMGPEATTLLMTRIINLTEAVDDRDHIPMFIDNNTQVPSRIKALIENTGEDPGPVLEKMSVQLENLGAQALAMPCNTAHYYADRIEKATQIPLLNMVELSVEKTAKLNNVKKVGILGSPAIKNIELYDKSYKNRNIETLYPKDQPRLLEAIRTIKSGKDEEKARQILENTSHELVQNGADILLVACSEFSIITDSIPADMFFVDTIDVLAQAVVDFAGRS